MRLILSRKGFDSSAGGVPSPIFEDGTLVSLPIPERRSGRTYADIILGGRKLGSVVEQLSGRKKVRGTFGAHLDPDLVRGAVPRAAGWRPSLGQCAAAQGLLQRNKVGVGDLFLFFGWFRAVEDREGVLRYRRGAPHLHVLFGWLQVGGVFQPPDEATPAWAADHPHVVQPRRKNNTLYVAAKALTLGCVATGLAGGGVFPKYREELRLTAPGCGRSTWALPSWFDPRGGRPPLGAHRDRDRWSTVDGVLQLRSVARGQEFLLDLDRYPEAVDWLRSLLGGGDGAKDSDSSPVRQSG